MQDKRPVNKQGEAHGLWEAYHTNGKLWYKRNFVNGNHSGYMECYSYNEKLAFKRYYAR